MRMPLPGGRAAALTAATPPPSPSETPPQADSEEMGETYTITPEEYAELGANKTVKCADGCTINVSSGGEAAPPPAM